MSVWAAVTSRAPGVWFGPQREVHSCRESRLIPARACVCCEPSESERTEKSQLY